MQLTRKSVGRVPEANGVILKAVRILRLMNAKIPAWFA